MKLLLANRLRFDGMHDMKSGQSLSHLKLDVFNGTSPSSVSIDSMNPCKFSDSIASSFVLEKWIF